MAKLKRKWPVILGILFIVGFIAAMLISTRGNSKFRCEVCITFQGRQACRLVDGPTEHEALTGAVNNTCAQLSSGVTDSIACEHTQPTKTDCRPID